MHKIALSILTLISLSSLVGTFVLLLHANNQMGLHHVDSQISFQAPPPPGNSKSSSRSIRTNDKKKVDTKKTKGKEKEKKKPEERKPRPEDKEVRPSGVSYNYIAPPKLSWKARRTLIKQFPHLADLSEKNEKDSTALCAFVKDVDQTYLDEWVDYHTGLGFHTIYLIDNSDEHDLLNWQNKRRNAGYNVRVMPKPGKKRRVYGYHMCASEHKNDHKFMAFFDIDEFLVLKKHATVGEMVEKHLKDGSLTISQHIFGTGNADNYGTLPVTKRFAYRDGVGKNDSHEDGNMVKSILKLSDYSGYPKSPRTFTTKKGTWKDTNGKGKYGPDGGTNLDRPVDVAVLHHYIYRSTKEFSSLTCSHDGGEMRTSAECNKMRKDAKNKPYVGEVKDNLAWEAMKKNVPKYAKFDEFEDFM